MIMKLTATALVNVLLGTALVTSIFFLGMPTSTSEVMQVGEYDPWLDYDESGEIDIFDAINLGGAYGTFGNPTKNVTVTNWPTFPWPVVVDGVAPGNYSSTVEITALDWTSALHPIDNHVYGAVLYSNQINWFLPFIFNPEGQLTNVTDLWIIVTMTNDEALYASFNITINDNVTRQFVEDFTNGFHFQPHIKSYHITDADLAQLIRPGINTLEFHDCSMGGQRLWFFRIVVFIEYEYTL